MILLNVANIRKYFGPEPVLDGVTFELRPGEKIALVGPNGVGKTTLLHILTGQLDADAGTVELHASARQGVLEQQPDFSAGRTVWDEAREALRELIAISQEAEELAARIGQTADESERRRLGVRFDRLQTELHQRDGYHLDHVIERVLSGLGFGRDTFQQPVQQLSGGQQNRLLLAKLLLENCDLMLLDEPSNHLDIAATEWLENFLVQSPHSVLVVSHDRYFLDKVSNRTLELYQGTVESYPGNYSAYRRQKVERLELQRRTYERQQSEIAKLEDFIRRNQYGQKHAQAKDRERKLERIEPVAPPREIAAPPMSFPAAARTGDIVLRAERLTKSFDRPLFRNVSFDILRGERWGIFGPNGSGKTTLLRCLIGQQQVDEGRVVIGSGVRLGYFDQQLGCLDPEQPVVEAIRPAHKEFNELQRRDLLAKFGLTGDMVFQRVGSLSGGERNRAALAMLAAADANFLILDEPTNHLDLWARQSLEAALKKFDGTVLFVSHDRYFLNEVADHLLIVEPDRFRVIDGNYTTYRHLVQQGMAGESVTAGQRLKANDMRGNEERNSPPRADKPTKRKRQYPYRKVEDLETEIAECEDQISDIHTQMATPEVLRDGARVKQLAADLQSQQQRLQSLYAHWEEACELN